MRMIRALCIAVAACLSQVCIAGSLQATASAPSSTAPATPADPGWPRIFQKDDSTVSVFQPQVDSWTNHTSMQFRCAVGITMKGSTTPTFGVLSGTADTLVDRSASVVLLSNLSFTTTFPGVPDATAATLSAVVKDAVTSKPVMQISLERVLAYMHNAPKPATVDVNMAPPPIYYRDSPAIMVIFIGPPDFKPVNAGDMSLMFAVNTNWVVILDGASGQYFLLDGDSWLTAPDPLKGPWTAAASTPASFSKLPTTGDWANTRKHIPGIPSKSPPQVIVSTEPAELIVTDGAPSYTPVPGTRLMYITNPVQPVFYDMASAQIYMLTAGRWFTAPNLQGPWTAASTSLPADFALIPPTSPVGFVLQSVPGTTEANDAVLLAQVPQKATVNIATTKVDVTYEGAPKFVPITGTPMTYAVNTAYQVIMADGAYYCCYGGVWFVSPAATGPWAVATKVPAVIYTIPPTCPVYNTTYVRVYDATPTTVVVGYTSGYSGAYVATTGVLMFGAGMLTGALLADNCWYHCYPCYYSYGCWGSYHYGCGGWAAGGCYYGPHGGCGWGAGYNSATGTWARGGYAYGPNGSIHGGEAYNPWTNTWAGHAGGSNGYSSWGRSGVSQNGNWAEAGHHTDAAGGTRGWAENSQGDWARGATTGNGSGVAHTSSGDVYADHDGNVYKHSSDGGWQKYSAGSGWNDVNTPSRGSNNASSWQSHDTAAGLNSDSWARNWGSNGTRTGDSNFGDRSFGGGWGDRSDGFGSGGWGNSSRSWGSSSGGFHGFGGFGGFRGRR